MEKSVLTIIAERHKEWVYIVKAYGCNNGVAEDIVQEMYIKMNRIINSGTNIMYNETEINFYYIIRTLKSIYIDYFRKSKNDPIKLGLENRYNSQSDKLTEKASKGRELYDFLNFATEQEVDYEKQYNKIVNELEKLYWFDKKVFEIINSGTSVTTLSRKTNIPYYTLYNTYRKVYKHLKKFL
jgi:DNA-directed RNA polymerase specialized sigma24 family protein